ILHVAFMDFEKTGFKCPAVVLNDRPEAFRSIRLRCQSVACVSNSVGKRAEDNMLTPTKSCDRIFSHAKSQR
ncbi:MAG: hypothetical protein ACK5YO_23270, partial [Planctomyces sp.]